MLVIDTFFIFLVQTDTNLIYIVGIRTTFIRLSFHLRNAYTVTDDNIKHQEYTSNHACNEEGGIHAQRLVLVAGHIKEDKEKHGQANDFRHTSPALCSAA